MRVVCGVATTLSKYRIYDERQRKNCNKNKFEHHIHHT